MFSDISDDEFLSATQLVEQQLAVGISDIARPVGEFSDVSDDLLLSASQRIEEELLVGSSDVGRAVGEFSDISNEELLVSSVQCVEARAICDDDNVTTGKSSREFRDPVSTYRIESIKGLTFAKRTVEKATWAVTLFGEWRGQRNRRCLEEESLVYLDKPFGCMTDDELIYAVPLFLAEVVKQDGSEYPPATLRDLVLSLQKHLDIIGRHVKFLTDDKFRAIRDTLDGLMKERARDGLGLYRRQAEVCQMIIYNKGRIQELTKVHRRRKFF